MVKSTASLKADVQLAAGGRYTLYTQEKSTFRLSGKKKLIAHARVAQWGFTSTGKIGAKLYVKVGSAWKWYDSGEVQLNGSTATALTLNLTQIPSSELNDVQEIGIEYVSNASGSQTAVYLSHISAE
jgi:mannan endo-1,4-beta-mannosidase